MFQLLEQYGTQEEANQFIHEHLQFPSFRGQLLEIYLKEANYHSVIEVANEGETQDQKYPGLLSRWKKFRYEAYKCLSLKEEQRNLAKELLFAGDFEYYRDLKELATESQDEFSFYENLKGELKEGNHYSRRMFLRLIEEENDLKEMLTYVQDNPSYIDYYAERLAKDFKQEVIDVYKNYIKSTASSSSNRREYQEVCHKIKKYNKVAGESLKEELITELMGLYKNRPAYIDELGKVN